MQNGVSESVNVPVPKVAEREQPIVYYVIAEYLPSVGKPRLTLTVPSSSSSPSSPVSSSSPTDEQDSLRLLTSRHSFPTLHGWYICPPLTESIANVSHNLFVPFSSPNDTTFCLLYYSSQSWRYSRSPRSPWHFSLLKTGILPEITQWT